MAPATLAQEFRATLTGNITDPQGAAVVGAKVTVKNQQTGDETVVTSGDEGSYTAPSLLPGRYTVTVEATGFKTQVSENVELHTADKATIDVALEIGQLDQVVTVNEADAPLLESDTATRGQVIENRRITELP
ncbi:MAG TPA: carboxypeptidase-like regulatory domain-containing protein, partial [Pyrinomonadaceae bacterium]